MGCRCANRLRSWLARWGFELQGEYWYDGFIFVPDRDVEKSTTRTGLRVLAHLRRRPMLLANKAAAHGARRASILKTIGGMR